MPRTPPQLDAEIAEALLAQRWQEQVTREERERRARIVVAGPTPEQLYEERQADVAAGVLHGKRRGRAQEFRRVASPGEALLASEAARRESDAAHLATEHRAAVEAHRRAAQLHRSVTGDAEVAWLHDLASDHRQATEARAREARVDPTRATRTRRSLAAYQEQLAAASEHGTMAVPSTWKLPDASGDAICRSSQTKFGSLVAAVVPPRSIEKLRLPPQASTRGR